MATELCDDFLGTSISETRRRYETQPRPPGGYAFENEANYRGVPAANQSALRDIFMVLELYDGGDTTKSKTGPLAPTTAQRPAIPTSIARSPSTSVVPLQPSTIPDTPVPYGRFQELRSQDSRPYKLFTPMKLGAPGAAGMLRAYVDSCSTITSSPAPSSSVVLPITQAPAIPVYAVPPSPAPCASTLAHHTTVRESVRANSCCERSTGHSFGYRTIDMVQSGINGTCETLKREYDDLPKKLVLMLALGFLTFSTIRYWGNKLDAYLTPAPAQAVAQMTENTQPPILPPSSATPHLRTHPNSIDDLLVPAPPVGR